MALQKPEIPVAHRGDQARDTEHPEVRRSLGARLNGEEGGDRTGRPAHLRGVIVAFGPLWLRAEAHQDPLPQLCRGD